jgi:Cft2 family RNA processing exonuclease
MMSEHSTSHDLAMRMIEDERQSVFFVGYSDVDTPAGRLRASRPGQTFLFSASAGELTRRCQMEEFDLTAHANRNDLLEFAVRLEPRAIILGHGQDSAMEWFDRQFRSRLPKAKIFKSAPGQVIEA